MPAPTRGMLPIEYWLEPKYGSAHGRAPTWESHLEKHPEDRERYNQIQNKLYKEMSLNIKIIFKAETHKKCAKLN